ncbi:SDR family NAD(P)-dependent oxidoreductase [Microbacterium sp.]|uniref:SDR family NAD(P)-dependent oxidoreductase n=1 Tax=Microbacterium sp. TaxID=51671 RepID=UPI003A8C2D91
MTLESMFSCAGQVAIVTGGATGIGRACAAGLVAAGARVALLGLGDVAGAAAEMSGGAVAAAGAVAGGAEISGEAVASAGEAVGAVSIGTITGTDAGIADAGGAAIGIPCDVTDAAALAAAVAQVQDRWGRIDTVLANAGAALDEPGATDALDRLDRMFDLHVRSVVRLSELTLPVMAAGGGGTFLVMSSLSGLRGNKVIGGYGITKAAVAQLARNIAVQWGPRGIRANALSPGVITTEFARPITADPEAARARVAKTPLGRFGTPAEVAAAVVWLASPGGAFVSGQNIAIDGGTLASD